MKKIFIVFIAALLFTNIILPSTSEAAAVGGKVVNQAAKKIAKEVAKDTAIDMTFNMVMEYKYVPKDQRPPKEGFEFICMPKDRSGDDCSNPVQVKKDIDRKQLGQQVEKTMEKKISGGIGQTKWGKVLDWVAPISAIGLGYAVIESAFNSDVNSFFEELAYDSLIDSGILVPESEEEIIWDNSNWFSVNFNGDGIQVYNKSGLDLMFVNNLGNNQFMNKTDVGTVFFYADRVAFTKSRIELHTWNVKGMNELAMSQKRAWVYANFIPMMYRNNADGSKTYADAGTRKQTLPKYSSTGLTPTYQPNTRRPVVSTGALPMKQTSTSEPVYPYKKPDGTIGIRDKGGIEIHEDDVTVLDPEIIENFDGSRTVKKAPTGTPTGEIEEPTPKQDGILPPYNNGGTGTGEYDLPEGQTCDATLQLPKFAPLLYSLSESFPFSIPWDLKSGFDALFSEMGSERPEFEMKFNFQGKEQKWDIKIPTFFDDWMPFIHSMLIFIFDVGIIYAIFRLIKGGGS